MAGEKKTALVRKRKIMAVQKVFQCTHCAFKCEKCGIQVARSSKSGPGRNPRVPYNFCEACADEYLDYIERLKGGGDPDCYWHNEAWLDAWRKWIDYQGCVDRYLKSKEFLKLVQEFKQNRPHD